MSIVMHCEAWAPNGNPQQEGEAECDRCGVVCDGPSYYAGFCCSCGLDICHECAEPCVAAGHRFE